MDTIRFRFGRTLYTGSRFSPAALISAATLEIFPATDSIRWADRRRPKKVADRKDNNSRLNFRRATAAKRFSRPTVKPVIKPMVSVFPVNIRRWPAQNLPLGVRSDRR